MLDKVRQKPETRRRKKSQSIKAKAGKEMRAEEENRGKVKTKRETSNQIKARVLHGGLDGPVIGT